MPYQQACARIDEVHVAKVTSTAKQQKQTGQRSRLEPVPIGAAAPFGPSAATMSVCCVRSGAAELVEMASLSAVMFAAIPAAILEAEGLGCPVPKHSTNIEHSLYHIKA